MSNRYSPYNFMMGLAVQLKRIKNGTLAQSRFTRYLETIENLPDDELHRLQAVELSKMLKHAVSDIPYYRHLKGEMELSIDTVHDDINNFPVVTKEILGSQKEQFRDTTIPIVNSMYSGGTTMTRVSVDTDKYSETHMGDEYFNRVAGIYPGMRRFIISRHESTYNEGGPKESEVSYYNNKLSRTYQVSPYEFNEKKLKRAYEMFEKARPEIIKGNTAMIVEFAESIEKNCWDKPKIPIAFCSQNTMQPEYIETLKRVFGSQVYNAYGATESGIVAAQCTKGDGLHYIPVRHYLETLSDGKQTTAGKTGSLIITSLTRYAMPIIRFQIGDYATPTDKKCPCGRTFPMLESIDGRLYEIINTPIGTVVSVYEVMTVIRKIEKIVDYQMVKENPDSVSLYLVISDGELTAEEKASLKTDLLKLFECKMNIRINYVPGITKLPSGKILRILSKERYDEARTSESRV